MRVLMIALVMIFSLHIQAITINVPADEPTIREGIFSAVNGDTILVADGVYTGILNKYITWNGNEKHLVVKSENGPENCIIDAEDNGCAFNFSETLQDSTDIIEGFTIRNTSWSAIICEYSSPLIIGNVIEYSNTAAGGGITLYESDAIVIGNIIRFNTITPAYWPCTVYGGGIYILFGAPKILSNYISNNVATASGELMSAVGGGIATINSNAEICNNIIIQNTAFSNDNWGTGGLCSINSNNLIYNNTISSNQGRGILVSNNSSVLNNIISNNSTEGVFLSGATYNGIISNNNVWGNGENFVNCPPGIGDTNWGTNNNGTACDSCFNISEDPLFVSSIEGNYFLSQFDAGQNFQSPCVNAGYGLPIDFGLEEHTTRTDLIFDEGYVDIGFHYLGYEPQGSDEEVISIQNNLLINYPNPFNPTTTIEFSIKYDSRVELVIYNIKGQKIKTLAQNEFTKGNHSIIWNGNDEFGKSVSSGVYYYKLTINGKSEAVKKCLLLK